MSARVVQVVPTRHDPREHGLMVIDPKELPEYARDMFSKQELEQWRVKKKNYQRPRGASRKQNMSERRAQAENGRGGPDPSQFSLNPDQAFHLRFESIAGLTPAARFQTRDNLTGLNPSPMEWRSRWKEVLELIFGMAIRLRISMARSKAVYMVTTAGSGMTVQAASMRTDEFFYDQPSEASPMVVVAFGPTITAYALDSFEDTLQRKEPIML